MGRTCLWWLWKSPLSPCLTGADSKTLYPSRRRETDGVSRCRQYSLR
jgi:hypothetical protein